MEWINIHVSALDSAEFKSAEPADRGTWLCLLRYCCGQEAGDRISGCKTWADRTWQQTCGVTLLEVTRNCGLWEWDGDDLMVNFYPHEHEKTTRLQRKAALNTNRKRNAKRNGERDANRDANGTEGNKTEENKMEEAPSLSVEIPSEAEVRTWAMGGVGVDPEYAVEKWHEANERHGWVLNGRLIDWKSRFKRYWVEDREKWLAKKKPGAASQDGKPPGWQDGDQDWWWTDPISMVDAVLGAALMNGDKETAARLREILKLRKG